MDRNEGVQATRTVNARRVAVRSIAWLDGWRRITVLIQRKPAAGACMTGVEWRSAPGAWKTSNTEGVPEPPAAPDERRDDKWKRRPKTEEERRDGENEHDQREADQEPEDRCPMPSAVVLPLLRII